MPIAVLLSIAGRTYGAVPADGADPKPSGFLSAPSAPPPPPTPAPSTPDCFDVSECRSMVQSARKLSEAGQLAASLDTYERAYARWPFPFFLINVGRIQQKLSRPKEAIRTYQKYLDSSKDEPPEEIARAKTYLEQSKQDASRLASRPTPVPEKSFYKRPWFWLGIAGSAVVVAAVATGVVLGTQPVVNGSPMGFHIEF